jgi:hypothetical protein
LGSGIEAQVADALMQARSALDSIEVGTFAPRFNPH